LATDTTFVLLCQILVENLGPQRKHHEIDGDRKQSSRNSTILLHMECLHAVKKVLNLLLECLKARRMLFRQLLLNVGCPLNLKVVNLIHKLVLLVLKLVLENVGMILCLFAQSAKTFHEALDVLNALADFKDLFVICRDLFFVILDRLDNGRIHDRVILKIGLKARHDCERMSCQNNAILFQFVFQSKIGNPRF
jgi:hypothetical protein